MTKKKRRFAYRTRRPRSVTEGSESLQFAAASLAAAAPAHGPPVCTEIFFPVRCAARGWESESWQTNFDPLLNRHAGVFGLKDESLSLTCRDWLACETGGPRWTEVDHRASAEGEQCQRPEGPMSASEAPISLLPASEE